MNEAHLDPTVGDWSGALQGPSGPIRVVLHITGKDGQLTGTWDVPDQAAHGMKLDTVQREGTSLTCAGRLPDGQPIAFRGTLQGSALEGTYTQAGHETRFTLLRGAALAPRRTPIANEAYTEELVEVDNAAIRLAGTLTLPRRAEHPPVLVFITGSGPQDRDEEVAGLPIFRILADALARHGIASLRLDDRGVADSTGDFAAATTEDFATDIQAAVHYLEGRTDLGLGPMGLLGHSEGGIIGPMVALREPAVKRLVLLAPPAEPGEALLLEQSALALEAQGTKPQDIADTVDFERKFYDTLNAGRPLSDLDGHLPQGISHAEFAALSMQATSPWIRWFLRSDPEAYLRNVRVPTLALFGSKDVQVPASTNAPRLRRALREARNRDVTVKVIRGDNHLFQPAHTGYPSEYGSLPKQLDPELAETIVDWMAHHR